MILRNVVGSDHLPPGVCLWMQLFHHFLVFLLNWAINQDSVSTQLLSDFHWIQSLLSRLKGHDLHVSGRRFGSLHDVTVSLLTLPNSEYINPLNLLHHSAFQPTPPSAP